MMGALLAWMGLTYFGLNYWEMLVLAPLVVGVFGMVIERTMLRWLYKLDHSVWFAADLRRHVDDRGRVPLDLRRFRAAVFGAGGLAGATDLGFMVLPNYRAWVVLASLASVFAPGS